MTKLAFLVAGVQKGGTSALHDYLRELPDLQLPALKEAHFFDDEDRDWSAPDYAPYHSLFADDGRLRGEATPIYLYWPPSLARIRAYNPAIKLILLFRDPAARAWSQWRMEWARGSETEPFAHAIRAGRARMADAAPFPGHHRVWSYVERGFYGAQLARALALFPRDRLLLLRSSDLADDPTAVVRRVAGFLGVRAPRSVTPRRVRVARDIAYPSVFSAEDVALLQRAYADDQPLFRRLSGLELDDGPARIMPADR